MNWEQNSTYKPAFFTRNTRIPNPSKSSKGATATMLDFHDILRPYFDKKETGMYGRAGAPGNSAGFVADGHSLHRIAPTDMRYTQKQDPEFVSFYESGRLPVETTSYTMQYTPNMFENQSEMRRVTPFIERGLDTDIQGPYRSNPFVQPLPRSQ